MSGRDLAVAAGAVVAAVLGSVPAGLRQPEARDLDVGGFALVAVAAGALAGRRAAPVVVLTVTVLANAVYLLAGYPYGPGLLLMGWAMFEVARQRTLRWSAGAAVTAAAVSAAAVLPRLLGELDLLAVGLLAWGACWLAVPWSLGALVQVRTTAARRERSELTARVALEERVRLSRDVHDVAGHGFAVIAMQAGVALVVLDERPEQVRASLEGIRATATAALADLRGVLDEPRSPAADTADPSATDTADPSATEAAYTSATDTADLAALVARARAAGLPVTLRDDAGELPAAAGDILYRVVRESLTNVIRHAGPTGADVTVVRDGDRVVVAVTDRGRGPAHPAAGGGRGLAGLRALVEAAGGSLTAAARHGGGFQVRADLPVPGDA